MFRSRLLRREFDDGWNTWDCSSSRIGDQDFGLDLSEEEFFSPSFYRNYKMRPRYWSSRQTFSGVSEVTNNTNKFQVILDVSHFKPEELSVKTVDNYVTVHAKHEERKDVHGFVAREFSRRYELPETVEPESVIAMLSSDGILKVEAPKKFKPTSTKERVIPVTVTEETKVTTTVEKEKENETVSI